MKYYIYLLAVIGSFQISCGSQDDLNPFSDGGEEGPAATNPISGGYEGLYMTSNGKASQSSLNLTDTLLELSYTKSNGVSATFSASYSIFSDTKLILNIISSTDQIFIKPGETIVATYEKTEKGISLVVKNREFLFEKTTAPSIPEEEKPSPPQGGGPTVKDNLMFSKWKCTDHNGNGWNFNIKKKTFTSNLEETPKFYMNGDVTVTEKNEEGKSIKASFIVSDSSARKYVGYQFNVTYTNEKLLILGINSGTNPTNASLQCNKN